MTDTGMPATVERLRLRTIRSAGRGVSVLVALFVCAVLAGCGSSSPSSSPTATTTTTQTNTNPGTTTSTTPGGDVSGKLDTLPETTSETGQLPALPTSITPETERSYLTAVFDDAQRFWEQQFRQAGTQYLPARLTLFASTVHSGCGVQEDVGPFYCGANRTVYLDLSFFELLAHHAGVGRFGQAYIVGHELGHHIQHVLGIDQRIAVLNHQDPSGENARSVRVELQADCLAGVWAHSNRARGELTDADLNDALKTATIVGDDFQQQTSGRVVDSSMWTHGSSEQRRQWLLTGFQSGHPNSCDTFSSS